MRAFLGVAAALWWTAGCGFDTSGLVREGEVADAAATVPDGPLRIEFDNRDRDVVIDFPLLVTLDSTRFDYSRGEAGGVDLEFRDADDVTVLAHEIERWNPDGTSMVWVQVPQIDAGSVADHIWLHYAEGAASGQDRAALWSDYKAVYHLSDDPADSLGMTDSGPAGLAAVTVGVSGWLKVAGIAGGGIGLDGANGYLEIPDAAAFDLGLTDARTIELSLRANPRGMGQSMFQKEGNCRGFAIGMTDRGELLGRFTTTLTTCAGQQSNHAGSWGQSYADGRWHNLAFVIDRPAGRIQLYVDGELTGQDAANATIDARGGTARIGAHWNAGDKFAGELDEIRVSDRPRSAAWISAQNAALRGTLVRYGE